MLNRIFQLDEADMLVYTDSFPMLDFTVMTNLPTEKQLLQLPMSDLTKLLNHPPESSKINLILYEKCF